LIGSRVLRIGGGIDYNLREKHWNAIFYFSHPLRRGGLFGRGSEFPIASVCGCRPPHRPSCGRSRRPASCRCVNPLLHAVGPDKTPIYRRQRSAHDLGNGRIQG
jgi:hypothetical protein